MTKIANRPAETSLMGTYSRSDLAFVRGEGAWLFDKKGEMFLDLASGIAVNSFDFSYKAIFCFIYQLYSLTSVHFLNTK